MRGNVGGLVVIAIAAFLIIAGVKGTLPNLFPQLFAGNPLGDLTNAVGTWWNSVQLQSYQPSQLPQTSNVPKSGNCADLGVGWVLDAPHNQCVSISQSNLPGAP